MEHIKTDYLIIGSGIAGLSAARALAPHGTVSIVSKSHIKEGSTQYAQGGIAVALTPQDTTQFHLQDTLSAGDELCHLEAVKILVEEGPERVKELINLGANFDKSGDDFDFTKEAAHTQRRILHAGDATGREIEKTLGLSLIHEKNVRFYPNTSVVELCVSHNECQGAIVIHKDTVIQFESKITLLATGGLGQLFAQNTNPPVATGDGIALAFQAGCNVQDMEFTQFHPTTLYLGDKKPISLFLISEAVRGEGGVLKNIYGERFMPQYHSDAELAPRDVVSRAIFSEMKKTKSTHVYLDLSHLKLDVKTRFPTIYNRCLEAQIDISKDLIPVAPAAHYFMGGISVDTLGETSVKRLYAAGETASLGLHGANRLASNSLLDGLVFGYRAGHHALKTYTEFCQTTWQKTSSTLKTSLTSTDEIKLQETKELIRDTLWNKVGIIRSYESLTQAQTILKTCEWVNQLSPYISTHVRDVQSLLLNGTLMCEFALARTESRGSHFRTDFPKKNNSRWLNRLYKTKTMQTLGLKPINQF